MTKDNKKKDMDKAEKPASHWAEPPLMKELKKRQGVQHKRK